MPVIRHSKVILTENEKVKTGAQGIPACLSAGRENSFCDPYAVEFKKAFTRQMFRRRLPEAMRSRLCF